MVSGPVDQLETEGPRFVWPFSTSSIFDAPHLAEFDEAACQGLAAEAYAALMAAPKVAAVVFHTCVPYELFDENGDELYADGWEHEETVVYRPAPGSRRVILCFEFMKRHSSETGTVEVVIEMESCEAYAND